MTKKPDPMDQPRISESGRACLPCLILGYAGSWLEVFGVRPISPDEPEEVVAALVRVAQDFSSRGQLYCRACGNLYSHAETIDLTRKEYEFLLSLFNRRRSNQALPHVIEGLQRDRETQRW